MAYYSGPPTTPTDLSVECPDVAVVVWRPGFDGGSEQTFVIEYSSNQSLWQTHRPKLAADSLKEDYLRTFVNDISPNTLYFFRIKAHNAFGEAVSESDVNCTRQSKKYQFICLDDTCYIPLFLRLYEHLFINIPQCYVYRKYSFGA